MSSGAWLKASGSRGVGKHKGTLNVAKRRLSTRNRSRVERLREYLNDLHLEEIESVARGHKGCGNAAGLQVKLRDVQVQEGTSRIAGISVLNNDPIVEANPIPKRKAGEKHTKVRSTLKKVNFDCSLPSEQGKSLNSGISFQTDNHACNCLSSSGEKSSSGTSPSFSCSAKGDEFFSSFPSGHVGRPKRKCDKTIMHAFVPLKDFSRTRYQGVCDDSHQTCDNDDDNPMDRDQSSLSPLNSPLYDSPPPSTPAQKQARREKRCLQLERWRKYEASKSRQERYQRRMQESAKTVHNSVQDSKRVKWSSNLVETVYIDNTRK